MSIHLAAFLRRARHLWAPAYHFPVLSQQFSVWSKHLTGLRWIGSPVRLCRRLEGPNPATNAKNLSGVIILRMAGFSVLPVDTQRFLLYL